MRFEFMTATRIIFGPGCISEAVTATANLGKKVLLVTGEGNPSALRLEDDLCGYGLEVQVFKVSQEPTIEMVELGVALARRMGTQVVVGFGGGSAIDSAKAIAGLGPNPGPILDYLEVVGKGTPLSQPALALVAVPTTAGTGTEVTRNAVLAVPEFKVKVSLRSRFLLPKVAVVDPELTYSVPPTVTASTGMDALAQVIEPFVSIRANPLVDGFCREGMIRAGRSLLNAYLNGSNHTAREDMSYTSLMGGLALANGGLGAVHGFAAPLGGMYRVAHGTLCARLLPAVVRVNIRALRMRAAQHPAIRKYEQAASHILGQENRKAEELADWLDNLCQEMSIPRLSEFGIKQKDSPGVIEKAAVASSMQANPIKLENQELFEIFTQSL